MPALPTFMVRHSSAYIIRIILLCYIIYYRYYYLSCTAVFLFMGVSTYLFIKPPFYLCFLWLDTLIWVCFILILVVLHLCFIDISMYWVFYPRIF